MAGEHSALDGKAARLTAALIALACAALLLHTAWDTLFPPPKKRVDEAALNPDFIACRDARLATVSKMKEDGVIDERQFAEFSKRAVSICAGQFPPGG